MQFVTSTEALASSTTDCLIIGTFEGKKPGPELTELDQLSDGLLGKVLKSGDFSGETAQTLLLSAPAGLACQRLLLVGCGKKKELDARAWRKISEATAKALLATRATKALTNLHSLPLEGQDTAWMASQLIEAIGQASYRFDKLKSKGKADKPPALKRLAFLVADQEQESQLKPALSQAEAINQGMKLCKDLANLPGNVCTPSYLADQAEALGEEFKTIKTSVLDEKAMEKLGMGALLSVSRGSREPAKLIVMEYNGLKKGAAKGKPIVLVGKGLTFDAGGISLKPAAAMDEMKYDMCGGASVFGVMRAIAAMKLPLQVVGVVPSSENLPDGAANKPGDIVTTMSGQTVEILNTDAEGRLILCDALTYSQRFEPEEVIDIATLTGACIVALGNHAAGLLGNDQTLCDGLLAAAEASGDRAWQLPLWPEYDEQLKSPFADMANIGGREAGTITAASFLARYTREMRWAHLDIAGTAWKGGSEKGATGRPVPLLTRYLIQRAGK